MRKILTIIIALSVSCFAFSKTKTKVKTDYSQIRGACHVEWQCSEDTIRTQLGYAKKIGLNSTRIWLEHGYDENPEKFIQQLKTYISIANEMGISVMPILFNGNGLNPATLSDQYMKEKGDAFATAIVNAVKDMDGLLCWDIMNEPACNGYYKGASGEEDQKIRRDSIFKFVRHYCQLVKKLAPNNDITVGTTFPRFLEYASPDLVDVLSFHDYLTTKANIKKAYEEAKRVADKYGKPMINNETGCIGRSNPYDLELQIANEYNIGWYVFDLMIGYMGDIHGIFYTDGTVRDPSIVTACMGIYRNKNIETIVRENPNREGMVNRAISQVQKAFAKDSTDDILEAAEMCANILESNQMVPMRDMPTLKINAWRKLDPKDRNKKEIRDFTYNLVQILKQNCGIL